MLVAVLYCPSCRNAKDHKPQDNEVCWSCVAMGGAGNYKESKTNYDRLTHMSMEELAEFEHSIAPNSCPPGIDGQACIDDLYAHGEGPYPEDEQCRKCWLEWLKQELKEDAVN